MEKYMLSEVQRGLIEQGIIDLSGDVDDEMADYVREALTILKAKGSPDITVEITSDGGDTDAGLNITDMLRLYSGKKSGKIIGFAHSMAAVILQVCDERLCARHATVMIHHLYHDEVSLDTMKSESRLKETIADMEKTQNRIYAIICDRTGKDRKTIRKKCKEERDMNAEEALNFGLIDKII
jgi:ATP-dependent Clp protease, protease subunit